MWIDDQILKRCREQLVIEVWRPRQTFVVLGASNKIETEVHAARCEELRIPVLRRYGGGGTVVLYPGSIVISIGTWVKDPFANDRYFKLCNQSVINALAQKWRVNLSQNGISDIVHGEKKVGGTSFFRSRTYLLYQASLLVDLDLDLISQCLQHPSKEPDYRAGRKHSDFLTDLKTLVGAAPQAVVDSLSEQLEPSFRDVFRDELTQPLAMHIPHLLARGSSACEGGASP